VGIVEAKPKDEDLKGDIKKVMDKVGGLVGP